MGKDVRLHGLDSGWISDSSFLLLESAESDKEMYVRTRKKEKWEKENVTILFI